MSQQLQITGGAKVRDLQDVIIGTSGVLSSLAFNVANGVPKLDVNGKILVSQLPNSVMEYKGTWDASTNTPTLVNGTGNQGDVYLCNVAGTTNFGAGPITFAVGDSAIYSGTIWQRAGGATGTVTSVGLTSTGNDAITITGSPITTSGNINLGFAGTNLQYINGAGDLTNFPTLITSIGLSMPSAFSVANSPLTANGTIAVTGAGVASQYIRGDGTLANFPTSGGGGSSVAYYFNSSVSQGTLGGVAYRELSKVPIIGAGTDITIATNGYIANYITDAGDPSLLEIPAGNWNFEMFFSASSNGGSPSFYVELYKYDGTTFTLISSSSATPEGITNGTAIDLYTTALAVPLTTLTLTDRLAIRVYVNNSGRTITLHTENSHLCEVITTFSTGIAALNGLTAQVQYFATGTSGTDFNISSATATHTFNLPVASATNTGKLSSTDWSTFNGKVPYTGAIANVDLGNFNFDANEIRGGSIIAKLNGPASSPFILMTGSSGYIFGYDAISLISSPTTANTLILTSNIGVVTKTAQIGLGSLTATRTYTLPDASGTLALLESSQTFTGINTFSSASRNESGILLKNGFTTYSNSYTSLGGNIGNLIISGSISGTPFDNELAFTPSTSNTYTFPNATGTLALTSDIPSLANYVTLNTIQTISANKTFSEFGFFDKGVLLKQNIYPSASGYNGIGAISGGFYFSLGQTTVQTLLFNTSTPYQYTFPAATGTLALTSNLSAYLPLTGGTLTGVLNGTTAAFSDSGTSINTNLISLLQPNLTAYNGPILTLGKSIAINNAAAIQFYYTSNNSSSNSLLLALYGSTGLTIYGNGNGSIAGSFTIGTTLSNGTYNYTLPSATGTLALGTGTTNYHAKWTGINTLGNSLIQETTASIGLGVTPNAWGGTGVYGLDISLRGAISAGTTDISIVNNAYYNGSGWIYKQTDAATFYQQFSGINRWLTAPSGTAGTAVTFTERMTFTQAGNLGIGTTTPNYKLHVANNTNGFITRFTGGTSSDVNIGIFGSTAGAFGSIGTESNHPFNIFTNGTDRMTITSAGNVGINTSAPPFKLSIAQDLTMDNDVTSAQFMIGGATTLGKRLIMGYDTNGDGFGFIKCANLGVAWTSLALNPNGGYVGIGLSSISYQLQLSTNSAAKPTSALWTIASDERIKENINPYNKGLEVLLKINPITYDYNGLGGFAKGKGGVGIIAQEIIDILPDSVSSIKAKLYETDENETDILNFNGHELTYVLINAIKEQQALITSLQSRLDNAGL